jgi:hypothetical protein
MKTLCQLLSVIIGLFAACWMFIGIIPFLGLFQWPALLCCVIGVIFGVFPQRKIGLTINIVVGVVAIVRLLIGAGVA